MRTTQFQLTLGLTLASLSCSLTAETLKLDQRDVASHKVTIYQNNNALIQTAYPVINTEVVDQILIEGLTPSLQPASILLDGIESAEILWSPSLDSYNRALQSSIGQTIKLVHIETGETLEGRLQAITPPFLQIVRENQISQFPIQGPWLPSVPLQETQNQGLLTLNALSTNPDSGPFSLSYLAANLGWMPEYTLELVGDTQVELSAQALLRNDTLVDFNTAEIDLLAGKPDQPPQVMANRAVAMMAESVMADSSPQVGRVQGYYLFELPEPIDLPAQTHKRVPLLAKKTLDAQLSYRHTQPVYAGLIPQLEKTHARQWLSFKLPDNIDDAPLPEGSALLYSRDQSQQVRFVGSQRLRDTSPGQKVEFAFGDAFDLQIARRQIGYQRAGKIYRQSYEVTLINGSPRARVIEYSLTFRQPWAMIESSQLVTTDGMEARWLVEVPANAEILLNYTVELNQN